MKTEEAEVINVVIVDDHVLYRVGVITALSSKKDIKIIGQADNGFHLLNLLKTVQPNIILLDIQMPLMDGIAALPKVKSMYPNIRIIILTMMEDQSMVEKLMELGANGYLTKISDSEVIYEAIKACHENEYYLNRLTRNVLLNSLKRKNPSSINLRKETVLSDKEIIVLRLMSEDKTTQEIAELVNLSPRTVEAIRDKLRIKTGTKNTAGLIMYAVKNKILNLWP